MPPSAEDQSPPSAPERTNGKPPAEAATAGPTQAEDGFWERLGVLTEAEWSYHAAYLYRLEPPVRNADHAYIQRFRRAFDQEEVLQACGSGRYLAILNNTRERKTVAKTTFSIHHPDAPPRVRLEQLAPEADESWRKWLEEVEAQRPRPQPATTAAPAAQPAAPAAVVDQALRTAVEQLGGVTQTLLSQRQPVPPSVLQQAEQNVSQIAAVIKELRTLAAPQPKEDSGVSVIREVAGLLKELRPEPVKEPQPAPAAPSTAGTTFLSQAKEAGEAIKVFRDLLSPGGGETRERRASWEEAEEEGPASGRRFPRRNPTAEVIEALGSAIGMAGGNLGMLMSGIPLLIRNVMGSFGGAPTAVAAAGAAPAMPTPGAPAANLPPGTIPRPTGPENLGAAAPSPSPEGTITTPPAGGPAGGTAPPGASVDPADAQRQQLQEILRGFGPQILSAIANGQDDPHEAGAGFANSVSELAGELQYRVFAALGVEGWMEALKRSPLWPQLSHAPEVAQAFVEGFIAFGLPKSEDRPAEPPKGKRKATAKTTP